MSDESDGYMGPSELRAAMNARRPPVIVDVRSGWEFRRGCVPGARHIPFWRVASRHTELGVGRESALLLYCGHGPRARFARRRFRQIGYRNLRLLRGHWRAWRKQGSTRS